MGAASAENEPAQEVQDNGTLLSTRREENAFEGAAVQSLMKLYYGHLFPARQFFEWLAYGNDTKHTQADRTFSERREICFTLAGNVFVRYQSYKSADELQTDLMRRIPAKIDIGPVYNIDPKRRTAYSEGGAGKAFAPAQRELVFDIDVTDYDDVRTCCQGGDICSKCWPLMAVAVEILDAGLREDFGFKCILWVFSGRRGIHCWVCDHKARVLTDEMRGALARYFTVYKGVEGGRPKIDIPFNGQLPPALDRAVGIIKDAWTESILPSQGLLDTVERWRRVLQFFGNEDFVHRLDSRWQAQMDGASDSVERWGELLAEAQKAAKAKGKGQQVLRALNEIYIAFAYPRLDVEVTKKMNHLLKAPFCVHPKTGKVCVPMDPTEVWAFTPADVPTAAQLLGELGLTPASTVAAPARCRAEETALAGSARLFQSFLRSLVVDSQKALNERGAERPAARIGW